jgi:hypothetical protein
MGKIHDPIQKAIPIANFLGRKASRPFQFSLPFIIDDASPKPLNCLKSYEKTPNWPHPFFIAGLAMLGVSAFAIYSGHISIFGQYTRHHTISRAMDPNSFLVQCRLVRRPECLCLVPLA